MSTIEKINNFLNNFFDDSLEKADMELYKSIKAESDRQQNHIELIASENIVSKAVFAKTAFTLTRVKIIYIYKYLFISLPFFSRNESVLNFLAGLLT